MRKPRDEKVGQDELELHSEKFSDEARYIYVGRHWVKADEARSIAAWLLKAADWLEEKEGES